MRAPLATVWKPMTKCTARETALVALFALALAAGVAAAGAAQEIEDTGPAATAPPSAVPLGQISRRSDALQTRLEQIEAERPTAALERLEAQLSETRQDTAAAAERVDALLARSHDLAEIEAQVAGWQRPGAELDRFRDRAGEEASRLDGMVSEIAAETVAWKKTLEEARRSQASPAVVRHIEKTLARLARAKAQLDSDLEAALALQERVRQTASAVGSTLERLETARSELASGLLVRRGPPVWRALPRPAELAGIGKAIVADLSSVWDELVAYTRDRRESIGIQLGLFLVLAWCLSGVRARWSRGRSEPGSPRPDALRHPWAAALLIAILLTPFLQPERVRGFVLVLLPVALVAWYLVLAELLAPALRRPLVGLAVLSLVEALRLVLIEIPLLDRAILVLELAAGLVGVLWLRRPERLRRVPWRAARSFWLRLLGWWMALVAVALSVGLGGALLGYTALADAVATLTIWGTLVGAAWVALVRIAEAVAEHLVADDALRRLRTIRSGGASFLRILRPGLRAAGLLGWSYVTLRSVGLWSPVRSAAAAVLSYPIGYGSVTLSFGAILAFGLTLWISWLLARFTAFVLHQEVFARVRMAPGVPFALETFTRYVILVIGFVIAMGALGFSLDRVTLLLSALGVGIGFGLQSVVNNFVSGAILLFERPIRSGDWIQLDDLMGTVSKIGLRASTLRTFDGADMIVPNGDLISARVINWTLSDQRWRIIVPVGVAYGTRPRRVLEILEEVARSHPEVLDDPAPMALFRGFGESALDFELRIFTAGSWLKVASDLTLAVSEALEKAGVTIPFPQRDLHLRNLGELRDALESVYRSPAAGFSAGAPPGAPGVDAPHAASHPSSPERHEGAPAPARRDPE